MFEKTKEKLNSYFEEHPKVKKGLKVAGGITVVAGSAFGAYKLGRKLERIEWNNLFKALAANGQIIPKQESPKEEIQEAVETVKDLILADNDHTFDVTFTDVSNGTKFIAKDYCLGSYVNDCLSGMDMDYVVEEAAKEVAETVAEAVTE